MINDVADIISKVEGRRMVLLYIAANPSNYFISVPFKDGIPAHFSTPSTVLQKSPNPKSSHLLREREWVFPHRAYLGGVQVRQK